MMFRLTMKTTMEDELVMQKSDFLHLQNYREVGKSTVPIRHGWIADSRLHEHFSNEPIPLASQRLALRKI